VARLRNRRDRFSINGHETPLTGWMGSLNCHTIYREAITQSYFFEIELASAFTLNLLRDKGEGG
jgi:hypothetical protein